MTQTTVTITVNIATGNRYEGNAELKINVPEEHLKYLDGGKFSKDIKELIASAVVEYQAKNQVI